MSVTTAIILDKRRMSKKTKIYPFAIRVTFNRDSRLFSIGIKLTVKDFEKLSSPNLGVKLREIKENMEKEEQRAKTIIKNLRIFSFLAFKEGFSAFFPHARKTAKTLLPLSLPRGQPSPSGIVGPSARMLSEKRIKRKNFKISSEKGNILLWNRRL